MTPTDDPHPGSDLTPRESSASAAEPPRRDALTPSMPLGAAAGSELAGQWRRLNRAATGVAILTSPALFVTLERNGLPTWLALVFTVLGVAAFRGLVDLSVRRLIPWPNLFGAESQLLAEDVVARRRVWFWRFWYRTALILFGLWLIPVGLVWLIHNIQGDPVSLMGAWHAITAWFGQPQQQQTFLGLAFQLPLLLFFNFLILFGPMLYFAIRQIKGYEPGDADWGVRLGDVRGQADAKQEITRIIDLWQSGEAFERAGGKRERGLLFLGPPGTGKTMLAKAIATGFNSPFVTIPGSGFAQMFIGMDVIVVQYMARKARKLAAKWGGQCIVFIDEIDAVGMRRASLGQPAGATAMPSIHDYCYHGSRGSLSSTCGRVHETAAWRDRQFADRADPPAHVLPPAFARLNEAIRNYAIPGGMMGGGGGGMALNQLLVVMDGIDDPPRGRMNLTKKLNSLLDGLYVVPQRVGRIRLRLPRPKPTTNQVYFIGACNAPLESLDPALTRPGRMGRHIRFRTPLIDDRKDIFDFYLGKVAHEPDLDAVRRRDELARITGGYSPAMIEQVCSMALTYAHHDGRERFGWGDVVEAITTVESGTATGFRYAESESRSTAIHEAGHAAASHIYMKNSESTRLSIKARGGSGGHHQARAVEERMFAFRSDEFAHLIWGMGAIAAEQVFYGENSNGVTGDMMTATAEAAFMVGVHAMGPPRIDFGDRFATRAEEEAARTKLTGHFEEIGEVLISRGTGAMNQLVNAVLADRQQRMKVSQLLGQSYFIAYCFIAQNRSGIEHIADTLMAREELHGDAVLELLDQARLVPATLDYTEERGWPRL